MIDISDTEKVSTKAHAYTPGLKVKRNATVIRERKLPLPGDILVKEDETVSYDTIVAETEVPADPLLLKASVILGVDEDEIKDFLLKNEGDSVKKDEVIGKYRTLFGLINREIASPINGVIESISELTGQVILRPDPIPVKVNAYIPGRVSKVIPREGVVIETQAAFIQGILGLGGEAHGELRVVVNSPEDELTADRISEKEKGSILVGGSLITYDAFEKAVKVGVSGLIAGGMNYVDIVKIMGEPLGIAITGEEEIGLTLIITEGFGKTNMSSRTFELLKNYEGYLAAINGTTQIRAGVLRPEIIIPNKARAQEEVKEELTTGMIPGTAIRIIRDPYFGEIGNAVSFPMELQMVETGSMVRVLVVKLGDGRKVVVPRANVEIIEE